MSKFNTGPQRTQVGSFIVTDKRATTRTHEGAPGYLRSEKSELFLLAVSNMVSEKTFYEKASDRDTRFEHLVHTVAVADPAWMAGFVPWLRNEANMRSASLVAALEGADAMLKAKIPGGRQLVASAMSRADEPGEAVAYWLARKGRKIPKPVKRGIADAVVRLYSERSQLKYDGLGRTFRFGDVLNLVHPVPKAPWQSELFAWAMERRYDRATVPTRPELLPMVCKNMVLREIAEEDPSKLLDADLLREAGFTWEDALSLAGSKVDKRTLWEALIPSMGVFAWIRNLRNFDQAGVSDEAVQVIQSQLANSEVIAKSRLFPTRFLAAYRNAPSLRWGYALEKAMNLSLGNLPQLPGRTLILVDMSGSMFDRMSDSSELSRADSAAAFGTALALRNLGSCDLVQFGSFSQGIPLRAGDSLLDVVRNRFRNLGGTNTATAVRNHFRGHDRVVILTDEQAHDGNPGSIIPATVPLYTWNLAGYRPGYGPSGSDNRHVFGGLTDAAFRLIPMLEAGRNADWPWMSDAAAGS